MLERNRRQTRGKEIEVGEKTGRVLQRKGHRQKRAEREESSRTRTVGNASRGGQGEAEARAGVKHQRRKILPEIQRAQDSKEAKISGEGIPRQEPEDDSEIPMRK